jgi:ABC-type antimicrobial peptide transport system permease subunit
MQMVSDTTHLSSSTSDPAVAGDATRQLPSVSVVICAFADERWEDTLAAVASVQAQKPEPHEVILVVDHNRALQARFAAALDVTVIENKEVRGLSGAMATLVVAEGTLSFLGLGIPPPTPSWGGMLAAGRDALRTEPQLVLVPALFFFFTVLAFNTLGDWARSRVGRSSSI